MRILNVKKKIFFTPVNFKLILQWNIVVRVYARPRLSLFVNVSLMYIRQAKFDEEFFYLVVNSLVVYHFFFFFIVKDVLILYFFKNFTISQLQLETQYKPHP